MSPKYNKLVFIINGWKENGEVKYSSIVKSQYESIKTHFPNSEILVLFNNNNFINFINNIKLIRKNVDHKTIIHAQYGTVTALTAALSKKKSPLVISFCGDDVIGTSRKELPWKLRSFISKNISFMSGVFANQIITKSINIFDSLPKKLQMKSTIIPNGVKRSVFYPFPKEDAKQCLNWHPKNKYILFNPSSGNNQFVKNTPLALEVFSRISKQMQNVNFVQIENKSPEEINLMMNAADCLLVTSLHEGSPNIVKEAMATNLPIVTVVCGDVEERLFNVKNSFISKDYNVDSLATLVIKVFDDGNRSNGWEKLKVDGLFDDIVAEKIIKIYEKL